MSRLNNSNKKELFKILVGAAWIDGEIQESELEYLQQIVTENELADDPEVQSLLSTEKPIPANKCYLWLENYLGNNPTEQDYQNLLSAISALVYSDGYIDTEEAKLLTQIQNIDLDRSSSNSALDKILKAIQKFYRQSIDRA
ncbi:MAG: TerB family tellurite resistance protein [Xenococcaceae cyanobacterium MO_188.B32]|nr:TerB family tellurite resistance protein [Xenococcaceae cyanobacterium MO_188.B32]